ncbi:MAG: DUF2085 domain-containing protein [Candidatus Thorarchaeota archaeon]
MNDIPQKAERKDYTRSIFLNLLITAFIIITYVYFGEVFGSISTIFIQSQEFILRFGPTLLIFTFFSSLAGSIHGFIDGFLAELLYQLAFYHDIYLEWTFIVGILGFLVGLYKYKPERFDDKIKFIYTFFVLVIASLVITGLIMIIQVLTSTGDIIPNIIIFNYGVKFFFQALISYVFLVPVLAILYDRVFSTREKHLYYIFLTHHPESASDHTFYLKFGRTKIFFCSRCSGVITGGLFALFFTHMLTQIFQTELSSEIALILIIILPLPGLTDWGTQRLLLRKSTTASRLFTGFIIGNALHFMSLTYKYYFFTIIILIIYFTAFGILLYLGHKKELRLFRMKEYPYISEDDDEDQD